MTNIEMVYTAAARHKLKEAQKQGRLTRQQYRTLYGQVMAGNPDAAMRGLSKILRRACAAEKQSVSRET